MRLLTAAEVAATLRVPPSRVYALVRAGLLPAVHVGRHVRVDEGSLEEWIARGGRTLDDGGRGAGGHPSVGPAGVHQRAPIK